MSGNRPDVTDEEIGMRTFHLRKSRAIERAMERLREGLKADYAQVSHSEIEALGWLFGEVWAYVARVEWDELHFSRLTITDVRALLAFAREIAKHSRNSTDVLQDAYELIASKSA